MLKSFKLFIEDAGSDDRGCVMAFPNEETSRILLENICPFQRRIEDSGYCKDIETEQHVTVLYGLLDDTPAAVKQALAEHTKKFKVTLEVEDVSLFQNDEFDVIKLNFKKNTGLAKLGKLNTLIRKFPNDCRFPDYNPHLTIAYVDPGAGPNLINEDVKASLVGKKLVFNRLIQSGFRRPDGLRDHTQVDNYENN